MSENKRFDMDYEETYRDTMYFDDGSVMTDNEVLVRLNQLNDDNEELKQRNKRQYNQLIELWSLIENKDWETLTKMVKQMEEDEERLQKEWKCYE